MKDPDDEVLTVELDEDTHRVLEQLAACEGRTLEEVLLDALMRHLENTKGRNPAG